MNTLSIIKRSVLCAGLFGLAWFVPVGRTQTVYPVARAVIPFAFHYGRGTLPAGMYTLRTSSIGTMVITGKSGSLSGLVRRSDGDRQPSAGKLVFLHEGTDYSLEQVWSPERNIHLMCPQPRRKAARRPELASATLEPGPVEVATAEMPR